MDKKLKYEELSKPFVMQAKEDIEFLVEIAGEEYLSTQEIIKLADIKHRYKL